jgi:hypothetical protein
LILIIEGPDGAGKSTLTGRIARAAADAGVKVKVWHFGPPDPPGRCPFTEYESFLDQPDIIPYILAQDRLLICDRFHTGEAIYGPVLRGKSRLTLNGMYHVELALEALGAIRLIALPPLAVVEERLATKPDQADSDRWLLSHPAALALIYGGYEIYGTTGYYNAIDTSKPFTDVESSRLQLDLLRKSEPAEPVYKLSGGTYIGSLNPAVLICGDIHGDGARRREDLIRPFTPVTLKSGSNFLLKALQLTGFSHKLGIVNVNDPRVDFPSLWTVLGEPEVIALGDNASFALNAGGFDHGKVPHPSYTNRFRHGTEATYASIMSIEAGLHDIHQ